jgi:hypothetical protein
MIKAKASRPSDPRPRPNLPRLTSIDPRAKGYGPSLNPSRLTLDPWPLGSASDLAPLLSSRAVDLPRLGSYSYETRAKN